MAPAVARRRSVWAPMLLAAVLLAGGIPAAPAAITIGGLPVRNLLSFEYESRYFLDGGALHCKDMRARCP